MIGSNKLSCLLQALSTRIGRWGWQSVVCSLGLVWLAGMATAAEKPNVLILLADDLGWADIGYRGSPIATPSIDRLAQEGIRLERFYVTPICSPTRAALLTNRDPLKLGIAHDQIHPWYSAGLAPDENSIATVFRDAGYQTGLVGKWRHGHTQAHQHYGSVAV